MPLPERKKGESAKEFIGRCMRDSVMKDEYSDIKQRAAICIHLSKKKASSNLTERIEDEIAYRTLENE